MDGDAFKNQKLSSHEYYQAKRWEGKPFGYKLKFGLANYPELMLMGAVAMITPFIVYYRYFNFPGTKRDALSKYKPSYTVVRDDDPNLEAIMRKKEMGREFFPQGTTDTPENTKKAESPQETEKAEIPQKVEKEEPPEKTEVTEMTEITEKIEKKDGEC